MTHPTATRIASARTLVLSGFVLLAGCGGGGGASAPAPTYTIGGRVAGLVGSITLANNGGDNLTVTLSSDYTFSTPLAENASYDVTIVSQPKGQLCTVANGTGTVQTSNVTTAVVTCTTDTFTISGTITGLTAGGLSLTDSTDIVTPAAGATSFSFPTALPYQAAYSVRIGSQPSGETCTVTNGSGSSITADVKNVAVACVQNALTAVPAPAVATSCTSLCVYVDAVFGSDGNNGLTPSTPVQTLIKAATLATPGTTVLINSGTYTSDGTQPPLTITTSGHSNAWITFAAAPGQSPVIQIPAGPGASSGIHILGASFIIINGLEIVGQNQSITSAAGNNGTQAELNENCIFVDGAFVGTAPPYPPEPREIMILNSTIHDCSAAGIYAAVADGLTIAYNQVYNNGWYTVNGSSGIDLYHLTDVTTSGAPQPTYQNVIVGNLIFNNYNTLPTLNSQPSGIYDGNGLIIDDSLHTQPALGPYDTQGVPYTARSYVANNVVYGNGGRGLHSYYSAHVDFVNNTLYDNQQTSSPYIVCCEIDGANSSDESFVNNIAINLDGKPVNEIGNKTETGNVYQYNLWNGTPVPVAGENDLTTAAKLANPSGGDFTPAAGSPALASGTNRLAPTLDFAGNARTAGAVDRGAIQVSH